MDIYGVLQILIFFGLIVAFTKPLGIFMERVFAGQPTFLTPVMRPVERLFYKLFGVREDEDQPWTVYGFAMLMFTVVGILLTYALLRLQGFHLPWNPRHFSGSDMTPDLSFNTAVSFSTNTNWQSYVPETTVSYFSNMVSLAIHNWMSAATGLAVAIAIVRGFARRNATGIGNFWVDVTRATLYVLLPISLIYAIFLVQQGVPQNFNAYASAITVDGGQTQVIPQGPVASQEAIKMLGTNGGGFFNANSAHPYENPTGLVNFIQMLSIFLIPAALTYTFGRMVGNVKQGWSLFAAMSIMFFVGLGFCYKFEADGNPEVHALHVAGGNMEGKETRFGIGASTLFATVTTDASCGAVNAMHDSFTPVGGLVPLGNIMTGELIFGGVGAGLYGMLMYAVLAVFIAGLMVGRTPEYLGKKIEQYEVKMAMLAVLILAADILGFSALAANFNIPPGATSVTFATQKDEDKANLPAAAAWNHVNNSSPSNYYGSTYNNVNNSGPHGLSEILYSYTSTTGNNGSAFAGITANTPFYNATLAISMLIGRFLMIIPLLAIAGSLAAKKFVPASAGTFPTDTPIFAWLLVGVVIIVGALTFFPAISLGPLVEHFQMLGGKTY